MTEGVVHRREREHYCFAINRRGVSLTEPYWRLGVGTVIQCPECGTCWRAHAPDNRGRQQYMGVEWRRETRWERWRRTHLSR